jgi:carbamoyltransferase
MHVLGLSFDYHDASAVLIGRGRVLAAAAEERFARRKHTAEFPTQAIAYCLREAGLGIDEVDHVVFYEKPYRKFDRILISALATWPRSYRVFLKAMPLWLVHKLHLAREIRKKLGQKRRAVQFSSHHLSHAASAFLPSPFEEAAILTADGVGEWATTSFGRGRGTDLELEQEIRFPHSLGLYYSALTAYLGFKVNDAEWKVMGLAPYGEPRYVEQFRRLLDVREDGSFALDMRYFSHHHSTSSMINRRYERLLGAPRRRPEAEMTDFHRDVARSGQQVLEEAMLRIARALRKRTGLRKLCIGGGVGLNCVANWKILCDAGFDGIFIQPAAGDDGGALGAAAYVYNSVLGQPRIEPMRHAALGPQFTPDEIRSALDAAGARYVRLDEEALCTETAQRLEAGEIVGWFQGRMEFGPRALGSRSILGNPMRADMKDRINARVKYRESFRPFAPSVPLEDAPRFFEVPDGLESPFMLLVPPVRPSMRSRIPAVTHQDGSARLQTVTNSEHPLYHRLLRAFGARTGVPVLLNTSFNVRGEPIVCTPADAWNCFVKTGIDCLVIGPFVVDQKQGPVDHEAGMRRSIALETTP